MVNLTDDNDKQSVSTTYLIKTTSPINSESIIFNTAQQKKREGNNNKEPVKYTIKQDKKLELISNNIPKTQVKQLFVGNLPFRVRWQDLKDLFRKAGHVQRADVALTYDGRSKGHGTVLFQTVEDAQTAIIMLHNFKWFGRILEVREDKGFIDHPNHSLENKIVIGHLSDHLVHQNQLKANNNSNNDRHYVQMNKKISKTVIKQNMVQPGRQLFVGNIPYYCQWQDIKDLFRGAGNILRADVSLETDGKKNLGFGIVLYATLDDAKRAIAMYDGYIYQGRQLKVRFDKYAPLMHYQDQCTYLPVYYSKKNTRDINSKRNYNYFSDKNSLEYLQKTNDDFSKESHNIIISPEKPYSSQPVLSHSLSEKDHYNYCDNNINNSDVNSNNSNTNNINIKNSISNNNKIPSTNVVNVNSSSNLFDSDTLTDSNSTVFSSSFTTQLNYEQQQQQQIFTNFYNLNHQYYNKSPNNNSFISNYSPSKSMTSIATGMISPPLYIYHENSPPVDSNLTFQLSPSSLDSIEKNTSSLSPNHFHNLNSSNSHHPFLTSSYDLHSFQQQLQQQNRHNKDIYSNIINNNKVNNSNSNDRDFYNEKNSIDQQPCNIDDKIHLMNVINTIGLDDDSAGLKTDFILSSFMGNIDDDINGDDLMKKDKFLESEISMLWNQS